MKKTEPAISVSSTVDVRPRYYGRKKNYRVKMIPTVISDGNRSFTHSIVLTNQSFLD